MVVALPGNATELRQELVPTVSITGVPARRGWLAPPDTSVWGLCARAPAAAWAPGVEDLIFARASELARMAVGADIADWHPGDVRREPSLFAQEGSGSMGPRAITWR